jgi:hypothetical protein
VSVPGRFSCPTPRCAGSTRLLTTLVYRFGPVRAIHAAAEGPRQRSVHGLPPPGAARQRRLRRRRQPPHRRHRPRSPPAARGWRAALLDGTARSRSDARRGRRLAELGPFAPMPDATAPGSQLLDLVTLS